MALISYDEYDSLVMIIPSLGETYFGKEPISCCDDQLDLKIM